MWSAMRTALLEAWAVIAPTECAGCGGPDRALCGACRAELEAAAPAREALLRPDGTKLALWHGVEYGGVARRALLAFKDGGRTDVAAPLAAVLRAAILAALAEVPPEARGVVRLAAIPSTRAAFRRRGYVPVRLLVARAGYRDGGLLRIAGQSQDQSELNTSSRFANRAGWLRARRATGPSFVLVIDDIVTTGATVLEADRAFRMAGHVILGVVAVARTQRRLPVRGAPAEFGGICP